MTYITISIYPDTHHRLKIESAKRRMTLDQVIGVALDALENKMENDNEEIDEK